jgi:hypothetical protein
MVSNSNQRSIYEGIGKVVGSSNRGFLSLDPERQCRIVTQPAAAAAPAGTSTEFRVPQQQRPGTVGANSRR